MRSVSLKGSGRMLGVVDRRGRLLNDGAGELPDLDAGGPLEVELVMECPATVDLAGKSICVSGRWYPT
jgi:hypothetical protein